MKDTKQIIVVRRDLKMRRGKEIAQGSHASQAWLASRINPRSAKIFGDAALNISKAEAHWLANGTKKVTCQVNTLQELLDIEKKAKDAGLECHVITDSGHTEFHMEPTITCLAIGPDFDSKIDPITGDLKLY
jgi:PTH2 family peptidyl-tRNA hydrolase